MTAITTPQNLQAAAQAAALAQSVAGTAGTTGATSNSGTNSSANALQSLAGNFTDFLNLLMTQLKNQDPSAPMDTNQFTTELVQFTGVQQQVSTNGSLGQLIQATEASQVLQSSALVGKTAVVAAPEIALQKGTGSIQFQGTAGEPIAIGIVDANGNPVRTVTLAASQGGNSWSWNGQTDTGTQMPDGAYRIAAETLDANGNAIAVPFSVTGTVSGVSTSNGTAMLDLGALNVPMSSVQSIGQ